jgi:hypothetical protein
MSSLLSLKLKMRMREIVRSIMTRLRDVRPFHPFSAQQAFSFSSESALKSTLRLLVWSYVLIFLKAIQYDLSRNEHA